MTKKAMILSAGLGKRAREISEDLPKPMIEIGGKTLIERMIINLLEAGIESILINTHYLAEKLEYHVESLKSKYGWDKEIELQTSYEPELLETGGSVKNNLSFFEDQPFFVLNCDVIWQNLSKVFYSLNRKSMENPAAELILAVTNLRNVSGLNKCDFFFENGKLSKNDEKNVVYTGLQLVNPKVFDKVMLKKFSFNIIFDQLIERNELYAVEYMDELFHVGDMQGYRIATSLFQEQPKKVISK